MTYEKDENEITRRNFLAKSAAASAGAMVVGSASPFPPDGDSLSELPIVPTEFVFQSRDSLSHGHDWQTLNPGFWKIENGALRRRLKNYGDRARRTGFPYHGETHGFEFKTQYDPSLPSGIIYQPNWFLKEAYSVKVNFTFRGNRPEPAEGDDPKWNMYQDGYGLMGIAIGGKSLFESYGKIINAWQLGWMDDGKIRLIKPGNHDRGKQSGNSGPFKQSNIEKDAMQLSPGDQCELVVTVKPVGDKKSKVELAFSAGGKTTKMTYQTPKRIEGYVGIASRGLIDFEVNNFEVIPETNKPGTIGVSDCLACYPLGDTLKKIDGDWSVRFVGMFATDGEMVEIRVSRFEKPKDGWEKVPVCGTAKIVNNEWRRNTAVIDVTFPKLASGNGTLDPSDSDLFYTVWKDGVDVTGDGRVGTDACGPGTGLVGDVPTDGNYVGRLPRLYAPYKLCLLYTSDAADE